MSTSHPSTSPEELLEFWFTQPARDYWFGAPPEFDDELADRYLGLWRHAALGRLNHWTKTAHGALALVIVLDQFPLNLFRNTMAAFATEAASRRVAEAAIDAGHADSLNNDQRLFLFLPFMHSESLADQDRCIGLFEQFGMETRWARHHREIIHRFGRFPHRNALLGRNSTPDELAWLKSDEAFSG